MSAEELLKEIKEYVVKNSPGSATITDVQFEGPEVVIYSKNPEIFSNSLYWATTQIQICLSIAFQLCMLLAY
ncbi:MAG TPA: hypothetical protein EYP47_03895, partial [Methanococcaceae archaeon]|nr:hypothetical protein [Methanococcaceae archaeon]